MPVARAQYRKVGHREKRKDRRILFPPLSIRFEGTAFETVNWSFGGFLVDGCHTDLTVGAAVSGTLGWAEVSFPFTGRVTRIGGEMKEVGVCFVDISDAALLFLDRRLSDFLSSKRSAR
jgi:hypothetical protein